MANTTGVNTSKNSPTSVPMSLLEIPSSSSSASGDATAADRDNWQQQWETEMWTVFQKIKVLERNTKSNPSSAEFMRLCNRVDLLDGKLNIMKTTLDQVLRQLNVKGNMLNKGLQQFQAQTQLLPDTVKTSAQLQRDTGEREGNQQFSTSVDHDQCADENDGADEDDWLPGEIEAEYDCDTAETEFMDVKPLVNPPEAYLGQEKDTAEDASHDSQDQDDFQPDSSEGADVLGYPGGIMHLKSKQTIKMKRVMLSRQNPDPFSQPIPPKYPPLEPNLLERNIETNLYECPVCHKPFKERTKVERHYVVHSGERPFACVRCPKTFTRKDKLTEHYRYEHPKNIPPEHVFDKNKEKRTFSCPDCGKISANKGNHEDHLNACRGMRPYVCPHPQCGRGFTQNTALRNHISYVHEKLKRFLCDDCGKSFSISSSYQRHMRMHRGDRPFACGYCEKTFIDNSDLRRHEKAHAGIKTVKCHLCDLTFYKYYALNQHMQTHTGEKPFVCDECGTTFGQAGSLNKHKLLHQRNGSVRLRKSCQRKAPYKPREPKVALIPELYERVAATSQSATREASDTFITTSLVTPPEDSLQLHVAQSSLFSNIGMGFGLPAFQHGQQQPSPPQESAFFQ